MANRLVRSVYHRYLSEAIPPTVRHTYYNSRYFDLEITQHCLSDNIGKLSAPPADSKAYLK